MVNLKKNEMAIQRLFSLAVTLICCDAKNVDYNATFDESSQNSILVLSRAPKIRENHFLIFVFVDLFSKSLVDFLFLLIFQQISTNQQIQQK